jgi:hypothetical protein
MADFEAVSRALQTIARANERLIRLAQIVRKMPDVAAGAVATWFPLSLRAWERRVEQGEQRELAGAGGEARWGEGQPADSWPSPLRSVIGGRWALP